MGPGEHRVRLGIAAAVLGSALLLAACGGNAATATSTATKGTPSPSRAATPSASTSVRPSASASSAAPSSSAPSVAPASSAPPPASVAPSAAPTTGQKYVVQAGDTLGLIAEQFGVTIQQLIDANKLSNPDLLTVGQELIIPGR